MVDTDAFVLEIKIVDRKATELTDTHPGSEQDYELVITLSVGFVVLDETHPRCVFLRSYGNPPLRVILNILCNDEIERVLSDDIFLICHLERRLQDSPDSAESGINGPYYCGDK